MYQKYPDVIPISFNDSDYLDLEDKKTYLKSHYDMMYRRERRDQEREMSENLTRNTHITYLSNHI